MNGLALNGGLIALSDLTRFSLAYLALVVAPGYALATSTRPRADRLTRVALAIPCSLSVVALYGLATALLRLPFTLTGYLCAVISLIACLIVTPSGIRRVRHARATPPHRALVRPLRPWPQPSGFAPGAAPVAPPRTGATRRDLWWVAPVAVALLEGVITLSIHARDVVPAAVDVLSHVTWTQEIMRAHTFPLALLSAHIGSADGGFYPPAFHALTALIARAASVPAYRAVFYSAVAASLPLPVALFVFARALTGSARLAGLAVLASLAFEPLPFFALAQGLYPFVASCLFVPTLAMTLLDGLRNGCRRALILAALLGVGLFYTHPTEFITVALLLLTVAPLHKPRAWDARAWRVMGIGAAAVAAAWGLAALPALAAVHHTMVAGAQVEIRARHDFTSAPQADARALLGLYVNGVYGRNVSYPLCVLAALGIAWCLARRRYVGLAAAQLLLIALYLDSVGGDLLRPLYVLSFPWALMERLAPTHYWLVPPLAALGGDAAWRGLRRLRGARDQAAVALLAAPCVALGLLLPLDIAVARAVAYAHARTVVAPADSASLAWLARHARPDAVVVNDEDMTRPEIFDAAIDAGLWMQALGAGRPLFGHLGAGPGALDDRIYLLDHIADAPLPPRAARLIARYHVSYIFYGAATPPRARRRLNLERLLRDPLLDLVHASGPACPTVGARARQTCGASSYIFAPRTGVPSPLAHTPLRIPLSARERGVGPAIPSAGAPVP